MKHKTRQLDRCFYKNEKETFGNNKHKLCKQDSSQTWLDQEVDKKI